MLTFFPVRTDILITYYFTAVSHKSNGNHAQIQGRFLLYYLEYISNNLQQFTKLIAPPFFADHIAYNLVAVPSYCVRV